MVSSMWIRSISTAWRCRFGKTLIEAGATRMRPIMTMTSLTTYSFHAADGDGLRKQSGSNTQALAVVNIGGLSVGGSGSAVYPAGLLRADEWQEA